MVSQKKVKLFRDVYFDPKNTAAFKGHRKVKAKLKGKLTTKEVDELLRESHSYTLHKPVRLKFPRRKFITNGAGFCWQADLIDMSSFSKYNEGTKWILCVLDIFSRKLYAIPIKNKTGLVITQAFRELLETSVSKISQLNTDRGKEFYNKHFQDLMKENNIQHYSTFNQEMKASLIERAIRTLKQVIYRYFTHSNSYRYTDVLQDMVDSYNRTEHSALGMAPNDVSATNTEQLWQDLYIPDTPAKSETRYKPGDDVRISKYASTFKKGYLPLWSDEIFTIDEVLLTVPSTYKLTDEAGDQISGTFYKQELQRVNVDNKTYRVEKILGTRKFNGRVQYLVRWVGYPPSFDSYVNKTDIIADYKN